MAIKLRAVAGAALLLSAMTASAGPVSYDFSIIATEGSATGSFTGDDTDGNGVLLRSELTSFGVLATGTSFTGGPIDITSNEVLIGEFFSFNLNTLAFVFDARNMRGPGAIANTAFEAVNCLPLCSVGSNLWVTFETDTSGVATNAKQITAVTITPDNQVPEPASWLIVGTAMAALGLVRTRKIRS